MPDLEQQLREDRALRDAARALVMADIAHLKREVDPASPSGSELGARAHELADDARDYLRGHQWQVGSVVAALIAAIALWIFRAPLVAILLEMLADDEAAEPNEEQAGASDRSQDETETPAETEA